MEMPSSIDQTSAAAASMLISWREVTGSHLFGVVLFSGRLEEFLPVFPAMAGEEVDKFLNM